MGAQVPQRTGIWLHPRASSSRKATAGKMDAFQTVRRGVARTHRPVQSRQRGYLGEPHVCVSCSSAQGSAGGRLSLLSVRPGSSPGGRSRGLPLPDTLSSCSTVTREGLLGVC